LGRRHHSREGVARRRRGQSSLFPKISRKSRKTLKTSRKIEDPNSVPASTRPGGAGAADVLEPHHLLRARGSRSAEATSKSASPTNSRAPPLRSNG
jgi:hypothetical protein